MKPITIVIEDPIFPKRVVVWIGDYDREAIRRFAVKKLVLDKGDGLDDPGPGLIGGCCWTLPLGAIIWLEKPPTNPEAIAMMVHETTHATNHIAESLGFGMARESSEFFSYYNDHLVESILNKIKK
jgi:hypothetical protein